MIIYVLVDPRTDEVRYVGATRKSLKEKLRMHLGSIRRDKNVAPRYVWLRELIAVGLEPEILQVDECDERDWVVHEDAWITYFRDSGDDLLNVQPGGGGPRSTAVRKRWTAEQKQQQSELLKSLYTQDPSLRDRVATSTKIAMAEYLVEHGDEFRRKVSQGGRKRYEDPVARHRTGDTSRMAWQDSDMRARHRESMQAAVAREARVKCPGCDMISRQANITRHRKARGH